MLHFHAMNTLYYTRFSVRSSISELYTVSVTLTNYERTDLWGGILVLRNSCDILKCYVYSLRDFENQNI